MQMKSILLTGDDGFRSLGIRLLVHYLKDKFDITIAATKTQQSGVGGLLTLSKPIAWEEHTVDGVPAICVHGSPSDAMEFASSYFEKKFDLVLSGINMGTNATAAIHSSGTVNAVMRALTCRIAQRGIAISWRTTPDFWLREHHSDDPITPYLDHPGHLAAESVLLSLKHDLWGAPFVNINVPPKPTAKAVLTRVADFNGYIYFHPHTIDRVNKTFSYINEEKKLDKAPKDTDAHTLMNGHVSISACTFICTHTTDTVGREYSLPAVPESTAQRQ